MPSGRFDWGHGGPGTDQLALAMLADALGDDFPALNLHQSFKGAVVAPLVGVSFGSWSISRGRVKRWARELTIIGG